MADNKGEPSPRLFRLGDLLSEWEAEAEEANEAFRSGKPRGPVSGLTKVDRELGGMFAWGLHILHGAPGAGKSALALQIATSCGCPCILVTCEMAPLELLRRLTARITNTFLGKLKTGELDPETSVSLARRAIAAAPELRIVDGTRAYVSPSWLREQADPLVMDESGRRRPDARLLVVVDSLHSWTEGTADGLGEYEALNEALMALRRLAHVLSCPILAIAERNRASMRTGGQHAGAGSRRIEYGAETVLDLHREENDRPDAFGKVPVELRFAKNRHGAIGVPVKLSFYGATQKFEEA